MDKLRTSVYHSDGMGRDTYISYTDGGFIKRNCNYFPVTGVNLNTGERKISGTKIHYGQQR